MNCRFSRFRSHAPGQYGISSSGDFLGGGNVTRLADGTDLNALWDELAGPGGVFDIWNKERSGVADLLSFKIATAGDAVPQAISSPSFSEATEFGVGLSAANPAESLLLGYKRTDHDLRAAFSARFLRDADRRQFEAIVSSVLNADNKLAVRRRQHCYSDSSPSSRHLSR